MNGPWLLKPCVCTLALCLAAPTAAGAQPSSTAAARRILASVDVSLTHRITDAAGAALAGNVTRTAFTLQKVRDESGKALIVLTYRPTLPAAATRATATPLDGGRIEYDLEVGSTTVFDEGGHRPNARLSSRDAVGSGLGLPASWLDGLVITRAGATERRQALERSHGRASGRIGRLARHVMNDTDVSEEVLADPDWAVPIEVTRRRKGAVAGHTRIEYGTTGEGHRVRKRITSDEAVEGGGGRRSILAVEFANVIAEGRQP